VRDSGREGSKFSNVFMGFAVELEEGLGELKLGRERRGGGNIGSRQDGWTSKEILGM